MLLGSEKAVSYMLLPQKNSVGLMSYRIIAIDQDGGTLWPTGVFTGPNRQIFVQIDHDEISDFVGSSKALIGVAKDRG